MQRERKEKEEKNERKRRKEKKETEREREVVNISEEGHPMGVKRKGCVSQMGFFTGSEEGKRQKKY